MPLVFWDEGASSLGKPCKSGSTFGYRVARTPGSRISGIAFTRSVSEATDRAPSSHALSTLPSAAVKATKPSDLVNSFKSGGAVFTAITTAAALLALIIGGLSVVNTMFMAVSERVREIGLKKAVGATTFNVMSEFLLEATFIGLLGGVLGYAIGAIVTIVANATTPVGQPTLFLITPTLSVLAIGFAIVLGAVAGVLPAWRAARMDPVLALRTE